MKYKIFSFLLLICLLTSCGKSHSAYTVGPDIPCQDSIQFYIDKANTGDDEAKFIAGILLYNNQTKQDSLKAFEYLTSSAEAGYSPAERTVAYELLDSTSNKYDLQKGIEWLTKSANHGHLRAKLELSDYYFSGKGVEADNNKALQLINEGLTGIFELADNGNSKAQWYLGNLFLNGSFLLKDEEQ